jgi:hypothetical protein
MSQEENQKIVKSDPLERLAEIQKQLTEKEYKFALDIRSYREAIITRFNLLSKEYSIPEILDIYSSKIDEKTLSEIKKRFNLMKILPFSATIMFSLASLTEAALVIIGTDKKDYALHLIMDLLLTAYTAKKMNDGLEVEKNKIIDSVAKKLAMNDLNEDEDFYKQSLQGLARAYADEEPDYEEKDIL